MEPKFMTKYISWVLVLMTSAIGAGCTMTDVAPPPLAGPSEMSLSLAITANPDVLSLDGSSQTLVSIEARDTNGQPAANVPLRVQILADGQAIDFGTISARTLVTGSNGRATFTYTAPAFISGGTIPRLQLSVTPTGTDASAHIDRNVTVRLVQPGVIGVAPVASFTFSPQSPAAFENVRFDASASAAGLGAVITSYVWDFGDKTSGTGVTASHQYSAQGTYFASLKVIDSNGLSNQSQAQAITVGAGTGPTANFIFSPTAPTIGQTIFFNGTLSTAAPGRDIVRYHWDFGTGSTRTGASVSKSYDTAGTFTVILTVTDDVGQTGIATQSVSIGGGSGAGAGLAASFSYSPTAPTVGQTIFFDGSPSSGTITSYAWTFGDGTSATGSTPTHAYAAAGTYVVRLTVRNATGSATTTQTVTISGTGSVVTADFNFSPTNPVSGSLVSFNASTSSPLTSIVRFDWDFGDGTIVNGQTTPIINHTFFNSVPATYTVRLTVHTSSGQTATTSKTVTVIAGSDPMAAFTVSPSPATVGAVITFDAAPSTASAAITRYEWDFGDGSVIQSVTPPTTTITHSYGVTGSFVIRLTVFDSSGRSGTTTRTLLVQ
jgi:PKD repeat protein